MKKYITIAALYAFGALASFGHAYHRVPRLDIWYDGQPTPVVNGPAYKALMATIACAGWPLYWSAILWEPTP